MISLWRRSNRFSSCNLNRFFSAQELVNNDEPILTKSDTKPVNTVGQYYHDMVFRFRGKLLVSRADLRKLYMMCENSNHVKYAVLGTNLFQEKKYDFNEELNSIFVSACIRGGEPTAAAKVFAYRKNRIGSWCTTTSLNRLLESLDKENDAEITVSMLQTVLSKGVRIEKSTASLALPSLVNSKAPKDTYLFLLETAKKFVSPEELQEIRDIYQKYIDEAPDSVIETAVEDSK